MISNSTSQELSKNHEHDNANGMDIVDLNNSEIKKYKQRIEELESENFSLKNKLEIIRDHKLTNHAVCRVIYENVHPELKEDIDELILKTIQKYDHSTKDYDSSDTSENFVGWNGSIQYYANFCVDNCGQKYDNEGDIVKLFSTPYYSRLFDNPLPSDENWKNSFKSAHTCFNCGDSIHRIQNCPHPIDKEKVRKAKIEHRQMNSTESESRIWDTQFQPGILSDRLKDALGIRDDEYPSYFDRMLSYGPPPGYRMKKKTSSTPKSRGHNNAEDYIGVDVDDTIENSSQIMQYRDEIESFIRRYEIDREEYRRSKRKYYESSSIDSKYSSKRRYDDRDYIEKNRKKDYRSSDSRRRDYEVNRYSEKNDRYSDYHDEAGYKMRERFRNDDFSSKNIRDTQTNWLELHDDWNPIENPSNNKNIEPDDDWG